MAVTMRWTTATTSAATTMILQSTAGDKLGGGYKIIGWVGGME
jgi:hypothetical protein